MCVAVMSGVWDIVTRGRRGRDWEGSVGGLCMGGSLRCGLWIMWLMRGVCGYS